jgi:aminoglycoside phosphotransferase (APT) family kinase protein
MASDDPAGRRIRRLLQQLLPDVAVGSVVALGSGLDHDVYELNGDLVLRLARRPDASTADRLRREIGLLELIATLSPVPVPQPICSAPEAGVSIWSKLGGQPLLDLPVGERDRLAAPVAAELGTLLARLHALPQSQAKGYAVADRTTLPDRRREAAELYPSIEHQLALDHRRAVREFLDAPPPAPTTVEVLSHNDLGIEHILVDPARDFGLLLRDLGPAALQRALEVYRAHGHDSTGFTERTAFYARCGAVEDLAYAISTGKATYREKTLTSLSWLFAPTGQPPA